MIPRSLLPARRSLFPLALVALWLPILYLFSGQWTGYPHYHYGLAVPFLSLYLFARRWTTRPAPAIPTRRRLAAGVITLLAVILPPAYLIQEASPIWRAASWTLAFAAAGITLALIYLTGGRSWLLHFGFPVLFFLVAVPWPTDIEVAVIDSLMRLDTMLTVEALNAFGIPALQHGNVIELATGMLGIDEACSGIRSTQANLMIALFLGEHARLSLMRRVLLVALGFAFAALFNFARTLLLAKITASSGLGVAERWHDPAGTLVLVACFGSLWWIGSAMAKHQKRPAGSFPTPGLIPTDSTLKRCLLAVSVWGLCVPLASEAWFKLHEDAAGSRRWTIKWPDENQRSLQTMPLSKAVREMLAFDQGTSVAWSDSDNTRWQMFYFRWLPARNIFRRVEVQFAKNHRPERCLPATGRVLTEKPRPVTVNIAGLSLPFRFYRFDDRGAPLHVYLCVQDDKTPFDILANMRSDSLDRLLAAWQGNRADGQQLVEVAIWGVSDAERSRAKLEEHLVDFIAPFTDPKGSPNHRLR